MIDFIVFFEDFTGVRIYVLFILLIIFAITYYVANKIFEEQEKILEQERKMNQEDD